MAGQMERADTHCNHTQESLASRNAYLERQYSQRTSGSGGDLARDSGGSDPAQCPLLHAESAPAELQGQRRGSGFSAAEYELHRASGGGGGGGGLAEMADMDEAAELEDAESRLDANGQPEAWWLTDSMQARVPALQAFTLLRCCETPAGLSGAAAGLMTCRRMGHTAALWLIVPHLLSVRHFHGRWRGCVLQH
jgi:hypothetical protein